MSRDYNFFMEIYDLRETQKTSQHPYLSPRRVILLMKSNFQVQGFSTTVAFVPLIDGLFVIQDTYMITQTGCKIGKILNL